ncbi:MAG TPA: ABC transporter ATP-binding protein [Rhizomicrobium sp.]|jgi:subfamily B ATP-binding cassette protein MsbA|nr:ABC transporter ATP-binding protein [Rhizomicrobium sp.]
MSLAAPKQLSTSAIVRRLLRDYVGGQWGLLALAVLCMLFASAMGGGIPWLVRSVTDQIFVRHKAELLVPLSLMAFGIMVLRAGGLFFGRMLIDSLGERAVAQAQRDMFGRLIRRDLADLNAVHSGQFVSNFLYDATLMRDALTQGVAAIFLELVQLVVYIGIVIASDWALGLLSLLALPAVAWAMERLGGSMRRAATRGMTETGDLSIALAEAMDGRRIIKAYGLEAHSVERVNARLTARLKTLLKAVRLRAAAAPVTDIFAGLVIAFVLLFAGYQSLHGDLTLPTFIGFITALLLAQQPVRNLSQLWPTASAGIAAANRMFAAIDARPGIVDASGATTLSVPRNGGAIAFDHVRFGYEGDAATLDDVTFSIPAGSKVALVGPSGAGKTTIFNLLLRFYERGSGLIAIDGADIHGVTLKSLRAAIGVVTQEAMLFDESIADNIALGRPGATVAEIEQAARDAAAHDFISEMPQGYQTRVGEGGLKLSGGQRQRIAIARAMLRNAPILLLDEATSALDAESERQVQDALARLTAGRTTIVIAHRLSTVRDADHIFVLDKGRVVQAGRHDALLAQGGLYAQLYRHNLDDVDGPA